MAREMDVGRTLGVRGTIVPNQFTVTLSPEDAASLYRSLPPDVGLVAVGLP